MDSRLLKSFMAKEGCSGASIAKALGISYSAWNYKANNHKPFTVDEAARIKDILSLSNEQASDVFFAAKGD